MACAEPQLSQPGGLGISGLTFGVDQLARFTIGSFKFFLVDSTFCQGSLLFCRLVGNFVV
ncbi:hypothetical protein ASD99_24350 [Mesorhizobium sp. Root695]|nr:hypothetical protein ASD99_24350 [Mesorhizobium sp. Root695]